MKTSAQKKSIGLYNNRPKIYQNQPQSNSKPHLSVTQGWLQFRILEAALAQQGGSERLKFSVFILLKNSVPVFYSACLPQAQ